MKLIIFILLISSYTHVSWASGLKISQILDIRPGEDLTQLQKKIKNIKTNGPLGNSVYEISTSEDNRIKKILIEFNTPTSSSDYLLPDTKGYCLEQRMPGDTEEVRIFFFLDSQIRYELNSQGLITSILIQDMPDVKIHPQCTFEKFLHHKKHHQEIKKVK